MDGKGDTFQRQLILVVQGGKVLNFKNGLAPFDLDMLNPEDNFAPDHFLGQAALRRFRRTQASGDLAPPKHRDPVAHGQNDRKLMGDERNQRKIVAGHKPDQLKELFCFRRRKGRSRFIQDEDPGTSIEKS